MTNKDTISHLYRNNSKRYNLLKAAEELQELALAITQSITKADGNNDNIIEEIGDVDIRLGVVRKYYSKAKIKKRIDYKIGKIANHIKSGKYKNKV